MFRKKAAAGLANRIHATESNGWSASYGSASATPDANATRRPAKASSPQDARSDQRPCVCAGRPSGDMDYESSRPRIDSIGQFGERAGGRAGSDAAVGPEFRPVAWADDHAVGGVGQTAAK